MSLFDKENNERRSRKPSESIPIGNATKADIWISEDGKRMHWGLSRVNPNDEQSPYRTLRPGDLGAATEALAILSGIFSVSPHLSDRMRDSLAKLSSELKALVDRAKNGFVTNEPNGQTHDVFRSQSR